MRENHRSGALAYERRKIVAGEQTLKFLDYLMNEINSKLDTVVIGGGISGLATAYRLQKAGQKVIVLEKNGHPGGSIVSSRKDGFLVDYGPNSTLETSPDIRSFVDELGLADRRVYANESASKRYNYRIVAIEAHRHRDRDHHGGENDDLPFQRRS